jgi:hypothetical protein
VKNPDMKILSAIAGFFVKIIAGSFVWLIIAVVGAFPLGLVLLKIFDNYITDNNSFLTEVNDEVFLLYILFTITCFIGIILARVVAVSIKVLADKKLATKEGKP